MKKFNRLLCLTLAVLMVSALFTVYLPVSAASGEGLTFTKNDLYRPEKTVDAAPNTFEAWIKLPKQSSNDIGGTIIGNYTFGQHVINLEIHSKGKPHLYWITERGKIFDWTFDGVNVCTDNWVHLAVVRSAKEKKVHCYINGELKRSIDITNNAGRVDLIPKGGFALGGDFRGGNDQFFKGAIKEIAIYSDVRTADEISADMKAITDKNGLLLHYDLSNQEAGKDIKDLSGNGCDLKYIHNEPWIDAKDMPKLNDYAYSFAVVGDTQKLNYNFPDKFNLVYDYILDNVEKEKIKFVFGLGDITETSAQAEWDRAKAAFDSLDGKVEYSIVRGNHDTVDSFNANVPWSKYKDKFDGSFANNMLNTYKALEIGEVKYLLITLDYGASDDVLAWAGKLCEQYPDHKVIITTHAYLYRDGTTLDKTDVCPPASSHGYNNGDHMWDKLVSKHENIQLVISGHDPHDEIAVLQTKGEKGNTVTQMLIDPQTTDLTNGGLGLVAMLYFSEDGKKVDVRYYSTVKKKYYQSLNQFSLSLEPVSDEESSDTSAVEDGKAPANTDNTAASGCSSTLSIGGISVLVLMLGTALVVTSKKEN